MSTYVAAHRTTHHAAHGMHDRQGLPALFGLAAEENFQGKTGQRGSAANFLPSKERQYKQEAVCAHGVGGQSNHPWDSDENSEASDALGGTVDTTNHAAMRVLAENRSAHGTMACMK
jgi:hypothetical protein